MAAVNSVFLFSAMFFVVKSEFCLPLLKNQLEIQGALKFPARIRKWDSKSQDFVLLEALKMDGAVVCSVDYLSYDDIAGRTIVVAVDNMYPYVLVDENYTEVTGYIGDIWHTLQEALKFKSIFIKGGRSAGEVLIKGTTDIWLSATTINTYTAGHYSYSHQIAKNSYSLFALSEGTRVSAFWYAKIFSRGLWAVTLLFVIVLTCMLLGMYRIKKATCQDYVECHDELDAVSLDFLCVLGGFTGQGFQRIPTSLSLRILILTSLMMGVLISGSFSSTMTSYLAFRGNFVPLTSLHDVKMKRTHSLCTRNDSGAYVSLTRSPDLELKPEWEGIVNTDRCPDMRDTKNLAPTLCRSGVIYLEAPDVFLSVYRRVMHKCRIVQLPGDYWALRIAFLFARSSPYRAVIDRYLVRLHSAGILDYLVRKWGLSKDMHDSAEQKFDFQPVENDHIQMIFLGLCAMLPISGFICILENIWHRIRLNLEKRRKIDRRLKILAIIAAKHFPRNNYLPNF